MTVCTWDPAFKGANVTLSSGNLVAVAAGAQAWVRATVGRDPGADATPRQWEIAVPNNQGAGLEHYRPAFGMCDEDSVYADGLWGYANIHGWSFGFGVQFIENDFYYHNNTSSTNWDSASNGGVPHVMTFIWFPQTVGPHTAGNIDVYMDGVFRATITGVTSGFGKQMFPVFGSGSNGSAGTFPDQGTANFGATAFQYPDPGVNGAVGWGSDVVTPINGDSSCAQARVLAGVRSLVQVSTTSVAASVYSAIAMLSMDTTRGYVNVLASLALSYQPGDLARIGSLLFAVGDDKKLHKYSTAPAETASVSVSAMWPWIAVARSFLVIHAGHGQIAVYNSSLVKLSQHPTSLADVAFATADSAGNVYAFDGRGYCSLLTVDAAGLLTFVNRFAVPNAVGIRSAWVDESAGRLVIGCAQQARVIVVNTATQAVVSSFSEATGRNLTSLCIGDPAHAAVFDDVNPVLSPDISLPFNCGIAVNHDSFVLGSSKASTVLLFVRTGDTP